MRIWIGLVVALAVLAAIVALGTAASLRYGVWGRRITAGLVVLFVVWQTTPRLGERGSGNEAHMITSLRALNVAQLLYSTTYGNGSYARTLDDLKKVGAQEFVIRVQAAAQRGYRLELIPGEAHYAAIAIPVANSRVRNPPARAFCMGESGAIYWAPGTATPVLEAGRCVGSWKPIQ